MNMDRIPSSFIDGEVKWPDGYILKPLRTQHIFATKLLIKLLSHFSISSMYAT